MGVKKPYLISTLSGGGPDFTGSARVAKYSKWIQSIFKGARLRSKEPLESCLMNPSEGWARCKWVSDDKGTASTMALPSWTGDEDVYLDIAPGTAVVFSDDDGFESSPLTGTVTAESWNNFLATAATTRSSSNQATMKMRVIRDDTPMGCIVSMTSAAKFCLGADQESGDELPSWISGHEVQVVSDPGVSVILSGETGLPDESTAQFNGFIQNYDLQRVKTANGSTRDFSQPKSMRVMAQ